MLGETLSIQELWDNFKWYNIITTPEGKEKKHSEEETYEDAMAIRFPNTMKKYPATDSRSEHSKKDKHQNSKPKTKPEKNTTHQKSYT